MEGVGWNADSTAFDYLKLDDKPSPEAGLAPSPRTPRPPILLIHQERTPAGSPTS